MSKRKRPAKSANLTFSPLEPRQLLAGDVVGPHQVAGSVPTGINILPNGDFETVTSPDDNFYDENEVDQWLTKGENGQLNILDYSDTYGNVLDLDSTASEFDRVYQNVSTTAGTDYLVTFDFRNHPSTPSDASSQSNDFEVWWNGQLQAIYTATDVWQTGTISVRGGSGASTELLFCEVSLSSSPLGDGIGALLDNIRVMQAREVILDNGSFESKSAAGEFNRPYQVDGWGAMGADINDRWLKVQAGDSQTSATDGSNYLNLDATESTRDIVFRDLDTVAGNSYYVTFDMRVDGNQATDPDELRVRWNQDWAGTFHGDFDWQNYGLMVTADSDTTRLTFLEPTVGNGSGPLIDNVRVFSITPASNDIVLDANGADAGTTGERVFIPGAGAQNIGSDIALTHESGNVITSAVVTLIGVADGNNEILSIASGTIPTENGSPKITLTSYRPETRQLQLNGSATPEEYQAVLRSLTYYNAADTVSTSGREVNIEVFNNNLPPADSSAAARIDLSVETTQTVIDDAILQKFIADNGLNATAVNEGLYAVIDEPGTGLNPTVNSTVRVAYTGKFLTLNSQNQLVEGGTFDASSAAGISFPLSNVIRGWQLGIPVFKTGGSGKLLIPSHLAYGTSGTGSIPPNAVLVFDVELLQIV